MRQTIILILIALCPTFPALGGVQYPSTVLDASGSTTWDDTWYTGVPKFSIDENETTGWTLKGFGWIDFDLGRDYVVSGAVIKISGHVSSGNVANIYVDGQLVATEVEIVGSRQRVDFPEPVRGQVIRYETIPKPYGQYRQVATWTEIGEFQVVVGEYPTATDRTTDNNAENSNSNARLKISVPPETTLPTDGHAPQWVHVVAVLCSLAFLTILLGVAIFVREPLPQFNQYLLRVVISVAAAGVGASLPGFLDLELPLWQEGMIHAGGALGMFVLVYLVNPPRFVEPEGSHGDS